MLACGSWLPLHGDGPAVWHGEDSASAVPVHRRDGPAPEAIAQVVRAPAAPCRAQDPATAAAGGTGPGGETLVHGFLLDLSGAPIQGRLSAGVHFVDRTGMRHEADARHEGTYTLAGLGFGTYWTTVTATGYRPLEATVQLCPDRPRLRMDFTMQRAVELRVRVVTPEGRSLAAVMVETRTPIAARLLVPVATQAPPGKAFVAAAGERNKAEVGHFEGRGQRVAEISPDCIGILYLDGDPPVHVSLVHHHRVLQTQRVDLGQDEVTFVVEPADLVAGLGAIRARVVDAATGGPIRGARVMLSGGTHADPGVSTDATGIAELGRREPGILDLQVWTPGYARFRMPVDALTGTKHDLGTIRLAQEVVVEGRVIDEDGLPLAASFSLGILDPGDRSIQWSRPEAFESSSAGTFCIRGLGRGEYVIRTRGDVDCTGWKNPPRVSGNLRLDTRAGPIAGLEIRLLPAARLVVRVVGTSAEGMRFAVVDERGLESVDGVLGPKPRPIDLAPGSYRVCLLDPRGTVLCERSVTLGWEPTLLDLAR